LIVVGSFLAGGAGKTPFTAWLAQEIYERVAHGTPVLNGGQVATRSEPQEPNSLRVEPGFVSQDAPQVAHGTPVLNGPRDAGESQGLNSPQNLNGQRPPRIAILCHRRAKDEAAMLAHKLPFAKVIATGNRYREVQRLDAQFDYILCDDGFEDTRLSGATTIRLDWPPLPAGVDDLLPAGPCRSLPSDHDEPALRLQCAGSTGNGEPDIRFSIARIENAAGEPFQKGCARPPAIACGIAHSGRFASDIRAFGITPSRVVACPDHDRKFEQTLLKIIAEGDSAIITEKDWARLPPKWHSDTRVYIAYQKMELTPTARAMLERLFLYNFKVTSSQKDLR